MSHVPGHPAGKPLPRAAVSFRASQTAKAFFLLTNFQE